VGVLKNCSPRPEVLSGEFTDALFAADFGDLITGSAHDVYGKAEVFFRNTYPTTPLKKIVSVVFDRLANKNEPGAILRLSTGFGGGKTHTLMALWHLAKSVNNPTVGVSLLPAAGRPQEVAVAAVDASKAGAPIFAIHGGSTRVQSLWGEIAWQLKKEEGVELLGEADDPQAQPDESTLASLFPDGPVLILLDELVVYMATLSEQGQGNLLAFLTKLAAVVGRRPQTVLVVTDPADQRAYAKEASQLGELASVAVKLDDIIGRKASDYDPIGDEAAKVIVTRLFEHIDAGAGHLASGEYFQLYSRVHDENSSSLPAEAATKAYADRIIECYPFHPRLLDTAQDRLGALQEFNKSRGTLRLFARLIRNVWERGEDVGLITAGEVSWVDDRIQAELLQRLNRDNFKAAVHADVEGHAGKLDEEWSTDAHTRAASALLLESIPNTESSGLGPPELSLAILRPSEAGHEPAEALERLLGVCWHTYPLAGGRGAQFRYEPNVIKQIEQRMQDVPLEDARSRVQSAVQGFFRGVAFKLVSWPTGPTQVPESADLQLALCANESIAKEVAACSAPDQPRQFRNAIVAITATAAKLADATIRAQRLIAAEAIEKENKGTQMPNKLVREQLAGILPGVRRQFQLQAYRSFDRVVVASGEVYPIEEGYLSDEEAILAGPKGQEALRKFLDEKHLVYQATDNLDVERFVQLLSGATPSFDTPDAFTGTAVHERVLAAPGLRLVADAGVVRRSIQHAVAEGKLVLRTANGSAYDDRGCVAGSLGDRRRLSGSPDTFPLDTGTLISFPDTASATSWLAEDKPEAETEKGAGKAPPPPPPPQDGKKTVDTWDAAVAAALERPLERLVLIADTAADAKTLALIAAPLGANDIALDVTVQGPLHGGGNANFSIAGAKLNNPLKPIDLAAGIATASDGPIFQAQLNLGFDDGRTEAGTLLGQAAADAPAGLRLKATFGKKT
jgi:hypothetical protein